MLDDYVKEQLAKYKEIQIISNKEKCLVSLVINTEENHIAVKKIITGKKADIYNKIKDIDNLHLPKIYLMLEEDDNIIVVEEYIEGKTLQDMLMASDPIDEAKLLNIIQQLCDALKLLHNLPKPIIHRDIKPSNIIMSKNEILKLIDFDASREYKCDGSKDTISLGTVEYAAPEQFGYSQTDIRSDVYAVGMLILEFVKKSENENYSYQHRSGLKKIIDRCTMFDPNQRYQNIKELQDAVHGIIKLQRTRRYIAYAIPIVIACISISILVISIYFENDNTIIPIENMNSDQMLLNSDMDSLATASGNVQKSVVSAAPAVDSIPNDKKVIVEANAGEEDTDSGKNADKEINSEAGNPEEGVSLIIPSSNTLNPSDDITDTGDNTEEDLPSITVEAKTDEKNDIVVTPGVVERSEPTEPIIEDNKDNKDENIVSATSANPFIDYYKNKKSSEDLKIYVRYNSASKVEYLSLHNYGHINSSNYSVEGNIITIKKEYLDTLPSDYYNVSIGFDLGNPTVVQFEVHAESEESPFGAYRLSHYYREFYTSQPEDFTYLVYNIGNTRIRALWDDTSKIDPSYYKIDENGYAVTLDKNYLMKFTEGTILKLGFEFENDEIRDTNIKIMNNPINQPSLLSAENTFVKSSPEDISVKIIWNDALEITEIVTQTEQTPKLSASDYQLDGDVFIIKKEVLQKLDTGVYKWTLLFDTGFGNTLTINILD